MKLRTSIAIGLLLFASCTRSNNILLGRVEEKVGSHLVIVTDCYRTSIPPAQLLRDDSGKPLYRFSPCMDADVVIDDGQLIVNGTHYGALSPGDTILVDHGKVLVNNRPRSAVTISE